MSQQLVAHSIHRASASAVSHVTKAARSHLVLHPGLSIKSSQWGIAHASQLAASFLPSSTAAASALYTERMTTNVARLYARRLVELASLSAATQVAVTNLEEQIEKPSEWGTIDLEKQRKEFGETISSLGKTKVSRVWAAGKYAYTSFVVGWLQEVVQIFVFVDSLLMLIMYDFWYSLSHTSFDLFHIVYL
jgi:hypothetical protein